MRQGSQHGGRPPHSKGRALRFEAMEPRLLLAADWVGLNQVRGTYGFDGAGQTVAVIDGGVDYNHAALGGFGAGHHVVGGYDFANDRPDPYNVNDSGAHGTHVAGIVSSQDPAHRGVASGADLVDLRVVDNQGASSLSAILAALQWVDANRNTFRWPITTVSLSFGTQSNELSPQSGAMLEDALAKLSADGVFVAVAAGNGYATYHTQGVVYPADSPYVVAVAAGDANGNLCSSSQRDAAVLVAPGQSIVSSVPLPAGATGPDNQFASYSGTSMAAPYVAGASMLLREAYAAAGQANFNEQTLYQCLMTTADTITDPTTGLSYHRLNLAKAVDSVMAAKSPSASTLATSSVAVAPAKIAVTSPATPATAKVMPAVSSPVVIGPIAPATNPVQPVQSAAGQSSTTIASAKVVSSTPLVTTKSKNVTTSVPMASAGSKPIATAAGNTLHPAAVRKAVDSVLRLLGR
jgi:subtilisin family serine protease